MKIAVLNKQGEKVKDIALSSVFSVKVSAGSLALYVNYLRNALRNPIANTKDRSDVSGGGKKPWKQKGTGRARQGSSRSPIWVGGGVTFGPTNDRNFKVRINKTTKKNVILGTIGNIFNDKKGIVIDDLSLAKPKTKEACEILSNIKANGKISLVLSDTDKNADKSFRNIAGIKMMKPGKINLIDLLSSDNLVVTFDSLKKIEEIYDKQANKPVSE